MPERTATRTAYDAVVVGARCAGAATALLLARKGLRVLAVDKSRHGSDTLSTHALMRGAVLQLHRWGLLDVVRAAGTPPVSTTAFHYGEETVEVAIKPKDGIDALYAPRRTVLDPILADAAAQAGAEVLRGPRLTDLIRGSGGRVRGVVIENRPGQFQRIAGDIVIGADGARSTVASLVKPRTSHAGRHAAGVVYGYWAGLNLTGYHWHFRPSAAAGAIPTNGGTCVFAAVPRRRFWEEIRFDLQGGYFRVLREASPDLAEALAAASQIGHLRGYPGYSCYLRQCWGEGWALVGDAAYFKDPITAHGITDALRDAELLARAVAAGTEQALAQYESIRDDLSLGLFRITDAVASFDWDFQSLQRLHRSMSDEARREVECLSSLASGLPAVAIPAAAAAAAGS